jgi:hypothetical protein
MIDERFAAAVSSWLRRTDSLPRQPRANVDRAMAVVGRTRQRSPWSPAALIDRLRGTTGRARADDSTFDGDDHQTRLIPVTRRGAHTMFEPTKLIAATAAVALGAGLLALNASNRGSDEGPAPAAATQVADTATWLRVTGTDSCQTVTDATYEPEIGGIEHLRGGVDRCVMDVDEPRLDGTWTWTWNVDCFPVDVGPGTDETDCLIWGSAVLDDPEAGWECETTGTSDPYNPLSGLVLGVCTGTGTNEGWAFVYHQTTDADVATFRDGGTIRGMIYTGDPPPRD